MKITDGTKTAEVVIHRWNGIGYEPDWAEDYFDSATYNRETGFYEVDDVDYCIDTALYDEEIGARMSYDENGDLVFDNDIIVDWEYLD